MEPYANNKDARYRYNILEKLEAGIVLAGSEVKAIKTGKSNLKGSYISFRKGEAFLVKAFIGRYLPSGKNGLYDAERPRKLLLNKRELSHLLGKAKEKGLTIVPLDLYSKRGIIKVTIAVARGKTLFDKREVIRERELGRKLRKLVKEQYRRSNAS